MSIPLKYVIGDILPKFDNYLVFKRFLKNVHISKITECWIWKGSKDKDGYGWFKWKDRGIFTAHIASYVLFKGHRHGKHVLHKCDNPPCVNPFHLWLGTQKDNSQDMVKKGRQHCQAGERNHQARLSEYEVEKIQRCYKRGHRTVSEIVKKYAHKFNVSKATVYDVVNGKTWKHIQIQ